MFYIITNPKDFFFFSFKDIHRNVYHIETMNKCFIKYIYITSIISTQKHV